ncbi:hypothetical protein ONS95_001301 [Cadophora gregata]|uniref:uncharacterized protein n=1 Tax=Cadophora gregata TaxID=51156 RepID=UPI0026DD83A5|nr:uncharacterized protein ONS95_001301 [Cadophora gregata]KAK0101887.1 hypothetical protein ONS96_005862 [Cadophora gregata f. sp. sojae]KAK0129375.1 hypothetical protein ONS95_001301 [Cadophora gregata]
MQSSYSPTSSPSVDTSIDLSLRPNSKAACTVAVTGEEDDEADIDQQLRDTMEAVLSPTRAFSGGSKTTVAPTREMCMHAKSMQLLERIRDSGFTTVRMSCGALERVFNCIGALKKQNILLNAKMTAVINNRQATPPRHPPPPSVPAHSFHLFSKLPVEIRCMIWNLALYTPRTISADVIIPRPLLSPRYTQHRTNLRLVCQEARDEAKKAQVALNKVCVGGKTIFINPAVDILWLSAWGISDDEWILVFKILHKILACNRLPRIAVSLELWDRLMSAENTRSRFLDSVAAFETKEIIIVMGSISDFGSPNLLLREPRGKPRTVLHTNFISRFRQLPAHVTWEELNDTLLFEVTNTKLLRAELRQTMISAGVNPDNLTFGGRFKDTSYWDFRKVHFMEATTYTAMKREKERVPI